MAYKVVPLRISDSGEPSASGVEETKAKKKTDACERRRQRIAVINPDNLPVVITVDEVAALLRLNRKTVYDQFKQGKIPGGRWFGRSIRFRRDTVLTWLGEGKGRASRSSRRKR